MTSAMCQKHIVYVYLLSLDRKPIIFMFIIFFSCESKLLKQSEHCFREMMIIYGEIQLVSSSNKAARGVKVIEINQHRVSKCGMQELLNRQHQLIYGIIHYGRQ